MKILCISASNTQHMGMNSTSYKTCGLIEKIVKEINGDHEVEILTLMNQRIKFCLLCGDCSEEGQCPYDREFNEVFDRMREADRIFIVVPHYSPIPSKLVALFEKINEIIYGSWLKIPQFESPFTGKVVGIIGHGGMAENQESLRYYHDGLIKPIASTLKSFGFVIAELNEHFPLGAPFGLEDDSCIQPRADAVFPDIAQNWALIEKRIRPLVANVLKSSDTKINP